MTPSEPAPSDHRRRRSSAAVLLGGVVLMLVVVAAAASRDEALWTAPETTTSETVEQETPADFVVPSPSRTDESGRWFPTAGPGVVVLTALLLAVAVVIAVAAVLRGIADWSWVPASRRRRRQRRSSSTPWPDVPRAVEADDVAMLAAIREGSPRNAIVQCWMLLEQDAAAAGMRRASAETSSEFVERVIGASSVDPQPIADLGALFRVARFSSRPVDETQRAQAEHALRRTLASLEGRTEQRA